MTRPGWAVIRIDHWAEPLFEDCAKAERPVDTLVQVKLVTDDEASAGAEVARLAALRPDIDQEYVAVSTELCGEIPARGGTAVFGLLDYTAGARVQACQVRLAGVWPDEARAELEARERGEQWRASVARYRPAGATATEAG